MTDYTVDLSKAKPTRAGAWEYMLYFVPVFVVAAPFSLAVWASYPLRKGHLPGEGPLARALRDARGITAQIIRV
jgi:PufQ cytochrome subunit